MHEVCSLVMVNQSVLFRVGISHIAHSLIPSDRSDGKSDCEQFAQVANDKRAKEQIAHFFLANPSLTLSLTKNKRFAQSNLTKIIFCCTFFWTFFVSFLKSF